MYKYRSTRSMTDDPPSLHPFQPNLFPSIARRTNVMLAFTNSASLILIIRGYLHLCIPSIPSTHGFSNQMSFFSPSVLTDTSIPPQLTTPPNGRRLPLLHPTPRRRTTWVFIVCATSNLGLFFLLPLRNQAKRKHLPTNSSFIDFNNTDILLLLSSSRFSFLVFLSFFPRSNQTLSVLFQLSLYGCIPFG
jgi:hypothetical protein